MAVLLAPELCEKLQLLAQTQLEQREALLLPDLSSISLPAALASAEPIVMELKPKWGLLPDQRWLQPAHQLKSQRSRFQLLQESKACWVGWLCSLLQYSCCATFTCI